MKHGQLIAYALFATCSTAATPALSQTDTETEEPVAEQITAEQIEVPANNAQVFGIAIGTYQTTSEDRVDGQG